jgi:tRNA(Ile)-lysidine synthase
LEEQTFVPAAETVARFAHQLDGLVAADANIGVAVSGGPDSLALLLLAAAARPGSVEAATVDHGFRPESRDEARMVAGVCEKLGVPHATLAVRWERIPETAVQERARKERYRLLGFWAEERGLDAVATGHHADDQAETFLMRLNRGAGVRGLAAMRPRSFVPGGEARLIRPLLAWRRSALEEICSAAGLSPAIDPSNEDDRFERVRVRRALASSDWLETEAVSRAASHLAEADVALDWAARAEWERSVREKKDLIVFRPADQPREILRRIAARAVRKLATEGDRDLRGAELDRLLATLTEGGTATLRGVVSAGGAEWRFTRAPVRTLTHFGPPRVHLVLSLALLLAGMRLF